MNLGINSTSGCHGSPDDEFMRSKFVNSCGQIMGGILADNEMNARRAVKLATGRVSLLINRLTPIFSIFEALSVRSLARKPCLKVHTLIFSVNTACFHFS